MGNGEMVDVARNMVTTHEYPTEERPTKAVVDKTHFQMVDNCKLLAFNILSISSLYFMYHVPIWFLVFGKVSLFSSSASYGVTHEHITTDSPIAITSDGFETIFIGTDARILMVLPDGCVSF